MANCWQNTAYSPTTMYPRYQRPEGHKVFRGTAYTDGSSINHAFPQARRAGYGAVIIMDECYQSDEEQVNEVRNDYTLENAPSVGLLGVEDDRHTVHTAHAEPVVVTVKGTAWPFKYRNQDKLMDVPNIRLTAIGSIKCTELRNKGVSTRWRTLTIGGHDVFNDARQAWQNHNEQAHHNPSISTQVTLIPPARIIEELAERRNCSCPNNSN